MARSRPWVQPTAFRPKGVTVWRRRHAAASFARSVTHAVECNDGVPAVGACDAVHHTSIPLLENFFQKNKKLNDSSTKKIHACQFLQTSIQASYPEYVSNSAIVSSIALLPLPQAGKTVVNRFSETSR